ncbi:MAG: hypothetical protein H8E44_27890, partial [Planctomycetes bacterium]|nr:hypothetical protein [Planctomycetota bacterium]
LLWVALTLAMPRLAANEPGGLLDSDVDEVLLEEDTAPDLSRLRHRSGSRDLLGCSSTRR